MTRRDPLRIGGAVLTGAAVVAAMAAGAPIWLIIDTPSIITVLGGGWLVWLAMVGKDRRVLRQVLGGEATGAHAVTRAEEVAVARRRATWGMGLLHAIAMVISTLMGLDDPTAWGAGLTMLFLPLLTATLADLLLVSPAISRVRQIRCEGAAVPGPDPVHQQQLDAAMDTLRKVRQQQSERMR